MEKATLIPLPDFVAPGQRSAQFLSGYQNARHWNRRHVQRVNFIRQSDARFTRVLGAYPGFSERGWDFRAKFDIYKHCNGGCRGVGGVVV